jgi:secreted trypsin-like serine protease
LEILLSEAFSPKLKFVTLPVVKNEDCIEWNQKYQSILTPNLVCAGLPEGRKDSCDGDSGGPLVVNGVDDLLGVRDSTTNKTSIATIYGIVSFGPKRCGKEGVPGVYTRVTKYIPWILSTMEGET